MLPGKPDWILAFAAALLLAGGVSLTAQEDCGCSFQVKTPNHTQELGGNSDHDASHAGLHKAVEHSGGVVEHVPHENG